MSNKKQYKLIVFTAPSGSGKSTIVQHLLDKYESLGFSVSATTRKKRPGEINGQSYYFLSTETFRQWIADDAFCEWEEVYGNQYYGTPKFEVDRLLEIGKHVIFDIDVKGALSIKNSFPDITTTVFIKVPDTKTLIDRLKTRETETEQSLQKRIQKFEEELTYANRFDHILVNDDLETTLLKSERLLERIIG